MISSLCKVSRYFAKSYNYPKNTVQYRLRYKATVVNSIRLQKVKPKKEPGEIFKWILLMIPVTSFGLGSWQIYRLQWKLELIDAMQAKKNATPIEMPRESKRESYGDSIIGYVQAKREGDKCVVRIDITPEHNVHQKCYAVQAICNETEEIILSL